MSTSRSFMTNFGLADSFSRFIDLKNDFKEAVTRFQKYVYFPQYIRVRTLQLRDTSFFLIIWLKIKLLKISL